jgi:hypothetical protein
MEGRALRAPRTRTFREEYLGLLRPSGVEFDERYVPGLGDFFTRLPVVCNTG